jgi:signal transduction histidine kinase
VIEDNGVGLNGPGSSEAGSGRGLALHSTLLAVVGGSLQINSQPGEYTCARIRISDGAGYPSTGSPGTSAA